MRTICICIRMHSTIIACRLPQIYMHIYFTFYAMSKCKKRPNKYSSNNVDDSVRLLNFDPFFFICIACRAIRALLLLLVCIYRIHPSGENSIYCRFEMSIVWINAYVLCHYCSRSVSILFTIWAETVNVKQQKWHTMILTWTIRLIGRRPTGRHMLSVHMHEHSNQPTIRGMCQSYDRVAMAYTACMLVVLVNVTQRHSSDDSKQIKCIFIFLFCFYDSALECNISFYCSFKWNRLHVTPKRIKIKKTPVNYGKKCCCTHFPNWTHKKYCIFWQNRPIEISKSLNYVNTVHVW